MFSIINNITVSPNFQIQEVAVPAKDSKSTPLYNSTPLLTIPLAIFPPGGIYKLNFNTSTFLELTLDRLIIQQTDVTPSTVNQDTFAMQVYNSINTPLSNSSLPGFTVMRNTVETLYVQGNGFTINTTGLEDTYIVTLSLPTYIPLHSELISESQLIYPDTSFLLNQNIINPQNWVITSPFGIQYTVGVTPTPGYEFTIGFDIPDVYGNVISFTINDQIVPNSTFESIPIINNDFVPINPISYFQSVQNMPMTIGGIYNYGNFYSSGIADGINAQYPVFFKEQIQYYAVSNSTFKALVWAILKAISLRSTKCGIRPYGIMLGSIKIGGYTEPITINPFMYPSNTPILSVNLTSNAQILPSIISCNVNYSSMSTDSSNNSPIENNQSVNTYQTSNSYGILNNIIGLLKNPVVILIALIIIGVILLLIS